MEPIKTTNNLTFDVKYDDGTKQEVETGILMEVLPDGKHIACHLGTEKASHIFSFILALEEMINKCGLDEVYKKYREEFTPNYEDKEENHYFS